MSWVNEKDHRKVHPVYWLTGLAGLGKTTIAYTICKSLDEVSIPFASFFCSLQLDSKNSKLLVPTLCRDLAETYNTYAANLLSTLETNSKSVHAGLRIQIDELLAKPWQASIAQRKDCGPPTPIVIVDALDESDRGTEFLQELLQFIQAGQLPGIKFLVTSRLEPKIVDICKSLPPNAVCKLHEVDTTEVQSDIEKYLREALPELMDDPGLAVLSQRTGGFFIYATTAVRFISPPRSPSAVSEMRSNLQAMLDLDRLVPHEDKDDRLLVDELYERILGDAFRNTRHRATRLQILHTIVCAESGINISVLADLTETEPDMVEKVVESLHAVLFVSPRDGNVYWYHASFPDFVFSQARARFTIPLRHQNNPTYHVIDVSCDASVHHEVLARLCFSIMQESLHFDMCNLPSSYLFDSEVSGLEFSINKAFSPTLRYVSKHWARHLLQATAPKNEINDLFCRLKYFMCDNLLYWIEAMNLIGGKYECSSLLKDAETWLKGVRIYTTTFRQIVLIHIQGMEWSELRGELKNAANFSTFFAGSPASKSTPHLYISAFSVWDHDSPVWRKWRDRFGSLPSISLPRGITIPLLTIPTAGVVKSIAFSPDGNRIVTGSDDRSVLVWDAKTGEQLRQLQGHTREVASVAISPDGNRIVSGSYDEMVRVWDAKRGEQLSELRGHTSKVTSVGFSPDGNRIVSGSLDNSVRVWDAKTGEQLGELQGDDSGIRSVAFSPDGNRIISGSFNKLQVWDAKTGHQFREMQGRPDMITSVAFSPDGSQIICGSFHKLQVWDAKTGEQVRELQGHTSKVNSVAYSPDGNRIVSGSDDKSVRVWDANTGEQLRELQGYTSKVNSVAFSPDGNRIVSGSDNEAVWVWDAKAGEQLREPQGHSNPVICRIFT